MILACEGVIAYWVYVLRCEGGRLYTGSAVNLPRRYRQHRRGTGGCKFTRGFPPHGLACAWRIESGRGDALRVESAVKALAAPKKRALVDAPEGLVEILRAAGREELAVQVSVDDAARREAIEADQA